MGKKGKKAQAGKPKKLTPKDVGKRLNTLAKNLEEELKNTDNADMFKPLPPSEDCAICLVRLSRLESGKIYSFCCGNSVCLACRMENKEAINKQNKEKSAGKKVAFTCPFCREPEPTSDAEYLRQLQARCLQNDYNVFLRMAQVYQDGELGQAKDDLKALECWIQAVELGSPGACSFIGNTYDQGNGVSVDEKRAALFYRMGALRGEIFARHNIGSSEYKSGNHEIGIRHWKIAAEGGSQPSLNNLKTIYNNTNGEIPGKEFIGKECMDSLYRVCHDAQEEIKSEEREKHCSASTYIDMKC